MAALAIVKENMYMVISESEVVLNILSEVK